MMNFEQALIKLKNGAKIRRKTWSSSEFVRINDNRIIDESDLTYRFDCEDLFSNDWEEAVEKEEYDWGEIIKGKILCKFSDFPTQNPRYGLLKSVNGREFRFEDDRGICWEHCTPVRESEVNIFTNGGDE